MNGESSTKGPTPPEEVMNLAALGSGAVRRRVKGGADTVMIPIGSCERHGNPHTPLGIDGEVTFAVVERAARKAGILHTPMMPFGYTPHHMGRVNEGCGTITLRAETYRRVLEDTARSLVYHGFSKLIFVSFHSFNVTYAEEVIFSIRSRTGAFVAFFGGRESESVREVLGSSPARMASDIEAAVALALLGDDFDWEGYLSHGYEIHAPEWLGPNFSKRAGTGMAVNHRGNENIFIGMDDFEFARPVKHESPSPSAATAEKGRAILDLLATDLTTFAEDVQSLDVAVTDRDYPERAR